MADIDFMMKTLGNAYEDMQKIRVSTKHQIRDLVRRKAEGLKPNQKEEKKEDKKYEKKYADENIPKVLKQLLKNKKITKEEAKYIEKCLKIAIESEKLENKYKTAMLNSIKTKGIYMHFLKQIKGIGPVLAANLIKEFGDCSRFDTVAKLWSYTGNGVVGGKAPRKEKNKSLSYSPRLRTFTWKISDCLMKSNKGLYRDVYDSTKKGLMNKTFKKGELFKKYGKPYKKEDTKLSKGHIHARALRKMRKLFLSHYWSAAREEAGLDTRIPYVQEHLGHKGIITWQKALKKEG